VVTWFTWNHTQLPSRPIIYNSSLLVITTNRLTIYTVLLLLLKWCSMCRTTFMLFNRSVFTIVSCCFTYWINFPHLNNRLLKLRHGLLLLIPIKLLKYSNLRILLLFISETGILRRLNSSRSLHVAISHIRVSCHHVNRVHGSDELVWLELGGVIFVEKSCCVEVDWGVVVVTVHVLVSVVTFGFVYAL